MPAVDLKSKLAKERAVAKAMQAYVASLADDLGEENVLGMLKDTRHVHVAMVALGEMGDTGDKTQWLSIFCHLAFSNDQAKIDALVADAGKERPGEDAADISKHGPTA